MCKCQEKNGYKSSLLEAEAKTKATGVEHVVFFIEKADAFFVSPASSIQDSFGVCCYYKADGTEVKYIAKGSIVETVQEVLEVAPKKSSKQDK